MWTYGCNFILQLLFLDELVSLLHFRQQEEAKIIINDEIPLLNDSHRRNQPQASINLHQHYNPILENSK